MPKHSVDPKDKKTVSISEDDRDFAYGKIRPLTQKACDEIERALKADIPCTFCVSGKPKKVGEDGLCIVCHGANMIPDHDQRKWGATEVLNRVAPAPKSVEMKMTDNRGLEDLVKEFDQKSPEEIMKLREQLGHIGRLSIVGAEEGTTGPSDAKVADLEASV